MFFPECGDILLGVFVTEDAGNAEYRKAFLFRNSVIHQITTFQRDCQFQRGKGFQGHALFARHRGCDAVETGESFGKAVGGVVAVFERQVNDLYITGSQFPACKGKPAVTDVFRNRVSTEHTKAFLEVEGRDADVLCHGFCAEFLCDVRFNVINSISDYFHPFHVFVSFASAVIAV